MKKISEEFLKKAFEEDLSRLGPSASSKTVSKAEAVKLRDLQEYQCWFELLKRSSRSNWTEKVQAYFPDPTGLTFEQWYWEMYEYFDRPDEMWTITRINDLKEYQDYDWDESVMIVGINIHATRSSITRDIEEALKQVHRKVGRPSREDMATINRAGYPKLRSIERYIAAYDAAMDNPRKLRLWELAVDVYTATSHAQHLLQPEQTLEAESARRATLAASISRDIRKAKVLIRGVERGVFPANNDQIQAKW